MKYSLYIFSFIIFLSCESKKEPINTKCHQSYRYFEKEYGNKLIPPNIETCYFDYEWAIECAKKQKKPILFLFNAHGAISDRSILTEPFIKNTSISKVINEKFIFCSVIADDKTLLPENEHYFDSTLNKEITTFGKKSIAFQIRTFKSNSQPVWVVCDYKLNKLSEPVEYTKNYDSYLKMLGTSIQNFEK